MAFLDEKKRQDSQIPVSNRPADLLNHRGHLRIKVHSAKDDYGSNKSRVCHPPG